MAGSAQQAEGGNTARRAWRAVVRYFRRLRTPDQLAMFILALALGGASAYGTIGFRWVIDQVQWGFLGSGGELIVSLSTTLPRWQILLAPCVGGLLIGLFIRYAMPDRRPLGVADVIEANALRGGHMSLTSGLLAAVTSAASVGVGASVGREGPVVHLGASMAAWVAKRLRLSRSAGVTLLGCGVAAAVAASFNAPIAGVFFALEVVVGHYAISAFAPIVIASVVGTVISRSHYGDFPAFILPEYAIASAWEFAVFALLGVASAAAAMMLMRAIMNVQDLAARIPGPAWLRPAMGGLAVGAIALVFPQVLGVGYETTDLALKGQFGLQILLLLFAAKILATAISLGMGFGGGVFSPSLVVGALLGGVFGSVMAGVYPALASSTGAYAMVGMGAVAGAVLGAPISTIMIIFELTGDYRVTIAVMVAVVIASLITQALRVKSFFIWQLERRGVDVGVGREHGTLRGMRVRDVMLGDYATIAPDAPVAELRSKLLNAPYGLLLVVGADGRLEGTVALSDLGEVAFDNSLDDLVKAGDAARRRGHVIEAGENLDAAWKLCRETDEARFPVVESRESMIVVGLLRERDVMQAYHQALLQARAEERGEA